MHANSQTDSRRQAENKQAPRDPEPTARVSCQSAVQGITLCHTMICTVGATQADARTRWHVLGQTG